MLHELSNLEFLSLLWVALLLVTVVSALLLAVVLMGPLRKLRRVARSVAQGNLDTPVEVKGPEEVADLANSVKTMALSLVEGRQQLSQSEARYKAIVETMNEGVMLLGPDQRITFCNGRMGMMSGCSSKDIVGKEIAELLPQSRRQEFQRRLEVLPSTFEIEVLDANASPWPALMSTAPISSDSGSPYGATLVVAADLREVMRLRLQAENSERLAAIGRLASTLAHELRNPLGVISNSVYFLKMRFDHNDEKVSQHLDILRRQVTAATQIIEQLLDYARPKEPMTVQVKLARLVEVALSQIQVPDSVKVEKNLADGGLEVNVDPELMQRVFWNLMENAIQAMPEGGTLDISVHPNGQSVSVVFRDTGQGISPTNLCRIFEPLFTTKAKGTGLGLAVSKSTVEKHGGAIEVESTLGKGSAFTVKLPKAERRASHGPPRENPPGG